jgi:hypothetical protein
MQAINGLNTYLGNAGTQPCSVIAYNITELSRTKALKAGGVGMIVTDYAAHKVCEQEGQMM